MKTRRGGRIGVTASLVAMFAAGCAADSRLGSQLAPDVSMDQVNDTPPVVYYYALSYAPARDRLALAGDGGVKFFDATSGNRLTTVDPGNNLAVIVREAANTVAAVQFDNLWLFDGDGRPLRHIQHDYQVFSLAVAPDGGTVVSGDVDGRIRRFRTADGSEITPALAPRMQGFVNDLQVSGDGLYVAGAGDDAARVWRTVDGALAMEVPGHANRVVFSPAATEIAVTGDQQVDVYSVSSGARLTSFAVGGVVPRIAYSSDGRQIAISVDNDSHVKVFDRASGAELVTLFDDSETRPPEQPGFRDVSELAFVGEDARLAVAWRSGRLSEWRVSDGALVWSRLDHDAP